MSDKQPDNHYITCKICNRSKQRIRDGRFKKKGGESPRWVNSDGKLWNGLVCPRCHSNQAAVRQANKRLMGE
jgi:Zn finger protein HypA/HybF involved in hydrogenase expression